MDTRQQEIGEWLTSIPLSAGELIPLAGDASFRRYFRYKNQQNSLIIMDAPPDKERCHPFLAVAQGFLQAKIPVPEVVAHDLQKGFMALSDFGDELLLNHLNEETAPHLYGRAFEILLDIQACRVFPSWQLPTFSAEFMQMELDRFGEWYWQGLRSRDLSKKDSADLQTIYDLVISEALSQPAVCIHRDYHSRNIMVVNDGADLGVLDFQDAMLGPVTYDLVSLLRDCYIDWPLDSVHQWILQFKQLWSAQNPDMQVSDAQFIRWFDWMGVQRHLKCVGIFARLALRDKKTSYLEYIPRIQNYLRQVVQQYPELTRLHDFLA